MHCKPKSSIKNKPQFFGCLGQNHAQFLHLEFVHTQIRNTTVKDRHKTIKYWQGGGKLTSDSLSYISCLTLGNSEQEGTSTKTSFFLLKKTVFF